MKILNVESQVLESANEGVLFELCLKLAKEAGYDIVRDNWGHNAYDEYSIDDAIAKFAKSPENWNSEEVVTKDSNDDLPF